MNPQDQWIKDALGVVVGIGGTVAGDVARALPGNGGNHANADGKTKSQPPTPPATPVAPPFDEAAITRGTGVTYNFALAALTLRHGLIDDEIVLWRDMSQTLVENMDGDASSISSMILKVVDIILTVAVPEATAFKVIYATAGAAMKTAQMGNDDAASGRCQPAESRGPGDPRLCRQSSGGQWPSPAESPTDTEDDLVRAARCRQPRAAVARSTRRP